MSAARRDPGDRRARRNHLSSPYARPAPAASKGPGWSFSGFLSSINPFKSKSDDVDMDDDDFDDDARLRAAPGLPRASVPKKERPRGVMTDAPIRPPLPKPSPTRPAKLDFKTPQRPGDALPSSVRSGAPPPTSQRAGPSTLSTPPSPSAKDQIEAFLAEKKRTGVPLNPIEQAGIDALLQQEEEDSRPFKFRFTSTPPPSSPTHNNNATPFSFGSMPGSGSGVNGTTQTPPKMLQKNPHGDVVWTGAGSSRSSPRKKNRHQSPAFGASMSTSAPRASIQSPAATSDTKRRRIGEDAESSSAQPSAPSKPLAASHSAPSFSSSSGAGASTSQPIRASTTAFVFPSTPRLPPKPTAPAIPSPLRQAWSNNSPTPSPPQSRVFTSSMISSNGHSPNTSFKFSFNRSTNGTGVGAGSPSSNPSPVGTPTKSASIMAELIKDASPAKKTIKADVMNPYQSASPVKPPPPKKPPPRKAKATKATKAAASVGAGSSLSNATPSPRSIIEATVPKGSKRSRPPTTQDPPSDSDPSPIDQPDVRRSARLRSKSPEPSPSKTMQPSRFSVFMPDEEVDDAPAAKKQKGVNGAAASDRRTGTVTVEEIDDEDLPLLQSRAARGKRAEVLKPSEVIEPDAPTSVTSSSAPENTTTTATTVPSSAFTFTSTTSTRSNGISASTSSKSVTFGFKTTAPKEPSKLRHSQSFLDDEEAATPASPAPTVPSLADAAPVPSFSTSIFGGSAGTKTSLFGSKPSTATDPAPKTGLAPSVFGGSDGTKTSLFGFKPAAASDSASSVFGGSDVARAESATKTDPAPFSTSIFGSPVPTASTPAATPTTPAAATTKSVFYTPAAPVASTSAEDPEARAKAAVSKLDSSELPTFFLKTKSSPKEASKDEAMMYQVTSLSSTSLPSYSFTFGGASSSSKGKGRAVESSSTTPTPTGFSTFGSAKPSTGTTPSTGFNWAAAGVKPPSGAGGGAWTCGACMLQNPASAKDKCTVCDTDRPASKGSASATTKPAASTANVFGASSTPPASSSSGGGFDWSAAGLKPPSSSSAGADGGSWTCGTCMLSNPASAKEKCSVCDTPRA